MDNTKSCVGRNGCDICYKERRNKYKHSLFSQIAFQLKFFWLIKTFPSLIMMYVSTYLYEIRNSRKNRDPLK